MKNQLKETPGGKKIFQEVEVRRLNTVQEGNKLTTKFEKHKVLRERVKITQDQADILNEGRIAHEANTFFAMYLLPGQEVEDWVREVNRV